MPTVFAPLDDALFDCIFQPLTGLMARRFGFGRRGAACFCIDVASAGWIFARARGLSDAVLSWDATASLFQMTVFMIGLAALIGLRLLFRRATSKATAGNLLRLTMRPHRAVILLMLVARLIRPMEPHVAAAAEVAMLVFATVALYLAACAKPPPVRRTAIGLADAFAR